MNVDDKISLDYVKFVEGYKVKDPRVAGQQSGDTIQLTRIGPRGTPDVDLYKLGDTVFAKHLESGAVVCAPWSNVRWARPATSAAAAPVKAGAK